MGYAKSLARKDYESGTKELVSICNAVHHSKESVWQSAEELIYQAAIFKACALLETYIYSVVIDWFELARKTDQTVSVLPAEMKWYFLFSNHIDAYRRYVYDNSEWQAISTLRDQGEHRLFDGSTPLSAVLNHSIILKGRKYPSVRNLDILLKRMGIANFFDKVDSRIRRSSKLLLESFLSIRQDIAHQIAPDLGYTMVREQVSNVDAVVGGMDRVLYAHVVHCNGTECWKTKMETAI